MGKRWMIIQQQKSRQPSQQEWSKQIRGDEVKSEAQEDRESEGVEIVKKVQNHKEVGNRNQCNSNGYVVLMTEAMVMRGRRP